MIPFSQRRFAINGGQQRVTILGNKYGATTTGLRVSSHGS